MHLRLIQLFILISLMTFLSACFLPATTTVHAYGRVLDSTNKRPIPDAHVSIKDFPDTTVLTTKDGTFDIPKRSKWIIILGDPPDMCPSGTIIVNAPGYETQTSEFPKYEYRSILLKRK